MSRPHMTRRPPPAACAPPHPPGPQPGYDELLHFFNESPDLLCIAGFDGKFKRLNPAWPRVLGWTREELEARPFLDFVHPDDRPATLVEMEKLAGGAITISFENRYHCQDGAWKWLQWTASPLPSRQEIYAIARDVTWQKRLEQEILRTSEREQQRIGRDLHDSLGPHLAAIRYAATFLANGLRQRDRPEAAQADKIEEMAVGAVALAQNLARGLLPVRMEGDGLSIALEDLAHTTSSQTGMAVAFCETGGPAGRRPGGWDAPLPDCPGGVEQCREARRRPESHDFPNKSADAWRLAVADDGQGMHQSPQGTQGMGLDSMRYRARALGGELKIESKPGEGTIVSCEIPHHPSRPAASAL